MKTDLFRDEEMPDLTGRFSMQEQIRCVEREIKKRRQVYPRLVTTGKMSAPMADQEIACMTQVLRTLRALVNVGRRRARRNDPRPAAE